MRTEPDEVTVEVDDRAHVVLYHYLAAEPGSRDDPPWPEEVELISIDGIDPQNYSEEFLTEVEMEVLAHVAQERARAEEDRYGEEVDEIWSELPQFWPDLGRG